MHSETSSHALANDRRTLRIALVEQHIRLENQHDLAGVLGTFGEGARYDDEAWDEHYEGPAGVRAFYEQLMRALPDLQIDVQRRHVTDDAILVEVIIRGTHLGEWRGLPDEKSPFPSAAFTPSTATIAWRERRSTTIAPRFCARWASSTSRKRLSVSFQCS